MLLQRFKSRIPKDLLKELNERFPEQCPSKELSNRDVWFYAGMRQLVRVLNTQAELQDKEIERVIM